MQTTLLALKCALVCNVRNRKFNKSFTFIFFLHPRFKPRPWVWYFVILSSLLLPSRFQNVIKRLQEALELSPSLYNWHRRRMTHRRKHRSTPAVRAKSAWSSNRAPFICRVKARRELQILLNVSPPEKGSIINEFVMMRQIKKHFTEKEIFNFGLFQLSLPIKRTKELCPAPVPSRISSMHLLSPGSTAVIHYPLSCPRPWCLFYQAIVFWCNHHFQQHEILFASRPANIGATTLKHLASFTVWDGLHDELHITVC